MLAVTSSTADRRPLRPPSREASFDGPGQLCQCQRNSLPCVDIFPACLPIHCGWHHQVWTSCLDGRWAGVSAAKPGATVFRTQPMGASLSDPALAPFRAAW